MCSHISGSSAGASSGWFGSRSCSAGWTRTPRRCSPAGRSREWAGRRMLANERAPSGAGTPPGHGRHPGGTPHDDTGERTSSKRGPVMANNIEVRHSRKCRTNEGGRCNCEPTFRADVWDPRDQRRLRYGSKSEAEAKGWLRDAKLALRRGQAITAKGTVTLREAWTAWEAGARSGGIRTRSRDTYKPSAIRSYAQSMRLRVLPVFGD